jgi:hypothetical protein
VVHDVCYVGNFTSSRLETSLGERLVVIALGVPR